VAVTLRNFEWLELTADLVAQAPARWPAERVARQLADTFRARGCVFYIWVSGEWIIQGPWPSERFTNRENSRYHLATADCSRQDADGPESLDLPRLIGACDQRDRNWSGVQHQLALPLLMTPRARRAFVVWRPDPFTEQDVELAHHLQRLLSALDHYVTIHSQGGARARSDAARTANDGKLTPRELAVLSLMAEGLTATSIGRKLAISERTVHKHLERTYAKLGVADRLSAVLRAQRIGLLPVS
jgi:DNA-binding CsgD family transcriptional regulator